MPGGVRSSRISDVNVAWKTASIGTSTSPPSVAAIGSPVSRSTATASVNGFSGRGVGWSPSPSSKLAHFRSVVSQRSISPQTLPWSTRKRGAVTRTLATSSPDAPIENGPTWMLPPTRTRPSK
jgi:hypothetical protein